MIARVRKPSPVDPATLVEGLQTRAAKVVSGLDDPQDRDAAQGAARALYTDLAQAVVLLDESARACAVGYAAGSDASGFEQAVGRVARYLGRKAAQDAPSDARLAQVISQAQVVAIVLDELATARRKAGIAADATLDVLLAKLRADTKLWVVLYEAVSKSRPGDNSVWSALMALGWASRAELETHLRKWATYQSFALDIYDQAAAADLQFGAVFDGPR